MKHQATRELFEYWNRLRGSRTAPERSEIEFAAIRNLLADMFMLEVDAAHRFPFVLSGTRVNALACAEQKGRSFLELWAPREQRAIAAMLLTVMDASCPLLATAIAAPDGWPNHEIEILFLPLGRPGHERARILGLISPSAAPSWLGLRPAKNMSLASLHPVGSENAARPFEVRTLFASAQAGDAAPETEAQAKKPYLKILDGGRRNP
ncbi:MAG: PAS domain-containing protein [Methylovirgula sp.]